MFKNKILITALGVSFVGSLLLWHGVSDSSCPIDADYIIPDLSKYHLALAAELTNESAGKSLVVKRLRKLDVAGVFIRKIVAGTAALSIDSRLIEIDGFEDLNSADLAEEWRIGTGGLVQQGSASEAFGYLVWLGENIKVIESFIKNAAAESEGRDNMGRYTLQQNCRAKSDLIELKFKKLGYKNIDATLNAELTFQIDIDSRRVVGLIGQEESAVKGPDGSWLRHNIRFRLSHIPKDLDSNWKKSIATAPGVTPERKLAVANTRTLASRFKEVYETSNSRGTKVFAFKKLIAGNDPFLGEVRDLLSNFEKDEEFYWIIVESLGLLATPEAIELLLEELSQRTRPIVVNRLLASVSFSAGVSESTLHSLHAFVEKWPQVWSYIGVIGGRSRSRGQSELTGLAEEYLYEGIDLVGDEETLLAVIKGLGNIGEKRTVNTLLALMSGDNSLPVRRAALFSLRLIDAPAAGSTIMKQFLHPTHGSFKMVATQAMAYSPAIKLEKKLEVLKAAQKNSSSEQIKREASISIGKLKSSSSKTGLF